MRKSFVAVLAGLLASTALALIPSGPATAHRSGRAPDPIGRLTIRAVGLRHVAVMNVGNRHGHIGIPPNVHRVGWWRHSQRLRQHHGSSLLVGHVSDDHDRPGAFKALQRVHRGDVVVWRMGKYKRRWKVTRIRAVPRTRALPDDIYRTWGKRRLNMVTCTHRVVHANGWFHYTKNLIITARPLHR